MMRNTKSFGPLKHRTDRIRLMGSSSKEWDRDFELFDQSYEKIVSGLFCMTESEQEKQSSEQKENEITFIQVCKFIWDQFISTVKLCIFIFLILVPASFSVLAMGLFFWGGALPEYALEYGINEMLLRWVLIGVGMASLNVVLTTIALHKLFSVQKSE